MTGGRHLVIIRGPRTGVFPMRIEGPERYQLTFGPESFTVLCAKGTDKFSGLAMLKLPKLYVLVCF